MNHTRLKWSLNLPISFLLELGIGVLCYLMAGSLVAAVSLGGLGAIAIFTCALTACAAAAARVVAGDSFAEPRPLRNRRHFHSHVQR